MDFNTQFTAVIRVVDDYLKEKVVFPDLAQKTVFDAMRYSLFAGGKRIRPVLALACAKAVGGSYEDALPFAASLEMIHTYSLIHDDLPAMDNDDFRRGKPTCHKAYGEDMAILAGDGLLNYACEFALKEGEHHPNLVPILKELFTQSGVYGMIGGQVIDLESEGKKIPAERMENLHRLKTGALLLAACRVGALSGGGAVHTFDDYAASIGLAFQIKDDILDVVGSSEHLGKPVGSDEKNQKSTYVSLYGLESAQRMLREETKKAMESVSDPFLRGMAEYLLSRDN